MTKKEFILSTIEKMGYAPEVDSDGDIEFVYQMKTLYVMIGKDDEQYVSVVFPHFYEMDEEEDTKALVACNKVTRELKMVKVFVEPTFQSVSAACEFYYINEEALEQNIEHSLQLLGMIRTVFKNYMDDLS